MRHTQTAKPPRNHVLTAAALFAVLFGLATVIAGGRVLFGPQQVRVAAGAIVPAVLWFNFLAGFAYLFVGGAMATRRRWAVTGAASIALATAVVYLAFGMHAFGGGAYELRTVLAMTLRTTFWFVMAGLCARYLKTTER